MGRIKNMNQEEEKAVEELKMRVKDYMTPAMKEDASIYNRFLKARDFDLDKAEKMLLKHITWRKTYQVDTIVQNFQAKECFKTMIEPSFIAYDKDGDMVLYSPVGSFNILEIFKSMKINNLMKHFTWFGERHVQLLEEHNKKTENCRYQGSIIFDLAKLTLRTAFSKLSLDLFLRIVEMYQDNYPERMKFVYVINAPSYYIYAYSVLKTVMASTTVKKIHIFNNDSWKESLLEFIDADVLPAFLGGDRTDPDGNPLCRSFVSHGGKIPEKYFLTCNDRYFQSVTEVTKMTLSTQEKKEIRVDIEEAGLLLEWEFFVRNKDIGFGVLFQDSERRTQEVIPLQRYDTPDGTEKDFYECQSLGTYIIIFDNSYSWMSSKTVEYSINVTKPSEKTFCKF